MTRILFLGDSYIAGAGVSSFDARFPVLVGASLGEDVEVTVLASAGWGTDQELLAYVQKGRVWQPDVVVLVFCANNDISNNLSNTLGRRGRKPYFVLGEDGALQLFGPTGDSRGFLAHRARRRSLVQSYLVDLVRYQLRSEQATAPPQGSEDFERVDPRYRRFEFTQKNREELGLGTELTWSPEQGVNDVSAYIHEDFETNVYQWALFRAILGQLAQITEQDGARLVVMLLPVTLRSGDPRFVVGSDYVQRYTTPAGGFTFRAAEPRDRLGRVTEELGVELYDPTRAFLEAIRRRALEAVIWPKPDDRHFSDAGHRLVAEIFERDWLETGGFRR